MKNEANIETISPWLQVLWDKQGFGPVAGHGL